MRKDERVRERERERERARIKRQAGLRRRLLTERCRVRTPTGIDVPGIRMDGRVSQPIVCYGLWLRLPLLPIQDGAKSTDQVFQNIKCKRCLKPRYSTACKLHHKFPIQVSDFSEGWVTRSLTCLFPTVHRACSVGVLGVGPIGRQRTLPSTNNSG
jgi:hypothetical protein